MSSTSIARQNRRKRLRQHPNITSKTLPSLQPLSVSELTSADEKTDYSDKDSKGYSPELSSNVTDVKTNHTIENAPYATLSFTTDCNFISGDISSQPVDKIFIEEERGFRKINASQIFHLSHANVSVHSESRNELIHKAYVVSKYFHSLSNFCHGLLGGISLLYLFVLLHLFSDMSLNEENIKYFSFFSKPIHNLFNFLCVICCVSTFDRFDINNSEELFKLIRKLDFKLITLLTYPICLLLSFTTANVDDKLSMPVKNATVWESFSFKEESELYNWKTLSISKCFGALLGWMIICWDQNFNLFLSHLQNILHRKNIMH